MNKFLRNSIVNEMLCNRVDLLQIVISSFSCSGFHPWPAANTNSFCSCKSRCRWADSRVSGQQSISSAAANWKLRLPGSVDWRSFTRCRGRRSTRSSPPPRRTWSRFLEEESYLERRLEEVLGMILTRFHRGRSLNYKSIHRNPGRNKSGSLTWRRYGSQFGYRFKCQCGKTFK